MAKTIEQSVNKQQTQNTESTFDVGLVGYLLFRWKLWHPYN